MRYLLMNVVVSSSSPLPAADTGLPGTPILHQIAGGISSWALIAAGVGIVIGAIMWAFGHYSQNYQQAYNGRRGVMVSALAGLLVGGATHLVGWFVNLGNSIK